MNRVFIHNAIFRICVGPIMGLMIYLLILLINNTVEDIDKIYSSGELYVCIAMSYISCESMRLSIVLLDKFSTDSKFERRLLTRLIVTTLVSSIVISAAIAAYFRWVIGFSIGSGELNLFIVLFGCTSLLYNILYFSQLYLQRENTSLIEQENKMRAKVEADFSSFKNDINPDLLYESLENLLLTIHHDADDAEEQIDSLAGIYRYSLVNRQKELVTLEEELGAANNLLHLLNHIYPNNLSLTTTVPDAGDIHLIPGSLMVTIDSIIRNTLIGARSKLQLRLYIDDDGDYLVLEHALNDKLVQHAASRNAFEQLQRSYLFFSDKPFVQVKAGRDNFIKFPLVRVEKVS